MNRTIGDLTPMQRSRLNKKAVTAVEDVCRKSACTLKVPMKDLTTEVFKSMLSHPICRDRVRKTCDEAVRRSSSGAIQKGIASVWGRLSASRIVGSKRALPLRRAICAAVAGPEVSFAAAKDFLGGVLKRGTFNSGKKRHKVFMDESTGSPELL